MPALQEPQSPSAENDKAPVVLEPLKDSDGNIMAPQNDYLMMLNGIRRKDPLQRACVALGISYSKSATLDRLRLSILDHWYPEESSQDTSSTGSTPSSRHVSPEYESDSTLFAELGIDDEDADEVLGYSDDEDDEDDEDGEEDEDLTDDESDSEAEFQEFKRQVCVEDTKRTETTRRPGGIKTQAAVVRDWKRFVEFSLKKKDIRDDIVDEHHLLLYLRFSSERPKRTRKGEDIPGTLLSAAQIKKLYFGALRVRKQQEAEEPKIRETRPFNTVHVWDVVRGRMNESLNRIRNGLVPGEDAQDIVANTFLAGITLEQMAKVGEHSAERIQAYLGIDHEPHPAEEGKPPAAWPTSGELVVEKLSARYSKNGPVILHDLSFRIDPGQRVGVGTKPCPTTTQATFRVFIDVGFEVGRTGSGKSSLTLALLHCILTEGTVYYDGIPTNKVNLDALRSNITIIPQTLISATLRRNLDPFEQHDDATLNDALRSAGLFSVHDEQAQGHITLDTNISTGGGSNFSVGEKQILALARAIVRGSKLLILDEGEYAACINVTAVLTPTVYSVLATSAIDYKTDAVIQITLSQKLDPVVTAITVAHRLQTIMDADKIMVLDDGRIAEFDSPQSLLGRDDSMFKALVDGRKWGQVGSILHG